MTERARLPERRLCQTVKFRWRAPSGGEQTMHGTVSYYDETAASIGEVFLAGGKSGSEFDLVLKDSAILFSLALQYGCPIDVARRALLRKHTGKAEGPLGVLFDLLLGPLPEAEGRPA